MQAWTPSETRSGYTMTTLQRGAATIVLYRPVLSEKERARREKQIQENLGRCMRDYLNRRNKP